MSRVTGRDTSRAVLSVGSNLGDRFAHLRSAVDGLRDVLVAASPVYETAPWGVVDQPDFLNAVLVVRAEATDAAGWLARARALEAAAGRVRTVHWGPRTLDVDVVTVEAVPAGGGGRPEPVLMSTDELTLPHSGAFERATVLVPWADVAPDDVLPGHGRVGDLAAGVSREGVRRRDDLVLDAGSGARPV